MLLNDFYTIHQINHLENSLTALIGIHKEHQIFKGHFPGQPVVPGVCMIQIVKELVQIHTGEKLILRRGNQIKFLQLVVPEEGMQLHISTYWEHVDDKYVFTSNWTHGDRTILKFQGIFEDN